MTNSRRANHPAALQAIQAQLQAAGAEFDVALVAARPGISEPTARYPLPPSHHGHVTGPAPMST